MPRSIRTAALGGALFALALSGCSAWQVQHPSGEAIRSAPTLPYRLLVEDRSGAVVQLANPQLVGDSLIGGDERAARPGEPYPRRAIALADVRRTGVLRRNGTRTAVLAAALPAALLFGGFFVGY